MSITFKILLSKRRANKQQQYPVILRVYKGAYYKEHPLNIKILETDWDYVTQAVQPSSNGHDLYNIKIASIKAKVQKQILLEELNDDNEALPEDIIKGIAGGTPPTKAKTGKPCIIKYGETLIKQLTSSGKVGNAFVYSCAVNKLKTFVGNSYPFEELNYKKLCEFQDCMLAEQIKVNTISVYMRTIRALFNRAIRECIIPTTFYPFTAYRIKNEKTVNRTLTLKEMHGIVNLSLEKDSPIWHWRNYFLLSFCLIGANFADLLTLTGDNIVDDRIVFRRKKTGKIYTIKLHQQAVDILGYYTDVGKPKKGQLLLPVLKQSNDPVKLKKDIWQAIKTCNEYLIRIAAGCTISKNVSTYYGRYTWSNIARSLGYSKDIIGQALGHSYGNATTSIYLDDYDNQVIDAANAKVIATVFNKQRGSSAKN